RQALQRHRQRQIPPSPPEPAPYPDQEGRQAPGPSGQGGAGGQRECQGGQTSSSLRLIFSVFFFAGCVEPRFLLGHVCRYTLPCNKLVLLAGKEKSSKKNGASPSVRGMAAHRKKR